MGSISAPIPPPCLRGHLSVSFSDTAMGKAFQEAVQLDIHTHVVGKAHFALQPHFNNIYRILTWKGEKKNGEREWVGGWWHSGRAGS